jgi:hypothetical protein
MIVPVFDAEEQNVVGTIDIESEQPNAFNEDIQKLLAACSLVISPSFPGRVRRTADPSASLGMTKGGAALPLKQLLCKRLLSSNYLP